MIGNLFKMYIKDVFGSPEKRSALTDSAVSVASSLLREFGVANNKPSYVSAGEYLERNKTSINAVVSATSQVLTSVLDDYDKFKQSNPSRNAKTEALPTTDLDKVRLNNAKFITTDKW